MKTALRILLVVALVTSVFGGALVAPAAAGGQDSCTDTCDDKQYADDGGTNQDADRGGTNQDADDGSANANDDSKSKTFLSGNDVAFGPPGQLPAL